MRIGFVSTASTWGGGERLLLQLAEGCRDAGIDPLLAAPEASELAQRSDTRVVPLPGRGRGPAALWRLRQAMTRDIDAVVLNDPHAITYGGVALAGIGAPRIGVRHTCFPLGSPWKHTHLVDHVVCVSNAARQNCLDAGLAADRLTVIHGGLAATTPTPDQLETARQTLAWGDAEAPVLLAIGSLLPVKGFDTLIEAVSTARRAGHNWRLAIAGEGPERETLTQLIEARGVVDRVRLLGFRSDISALLRLADGFVNASHNEGLSLVLIEAMHAAAPIVSTAAGGSAEVLGTTEANATPVARVFEPGDVAGAVEAIGATLSHKEDAVERAAAGRKRAEERFSVATMVDGYVRLIDRLRAESPGHAA